MVEIFGFLQTFLSELKLKNAERHKNKTKTNKQKKKKKNPRNNNRKMYGIYIIYMFLNEQFSDYSCLHVTAERSVFSYIANTCLTLLISVFCFFRLLPVSHYASTISDLVV